MRRWDLLEYLIYGIGWALAAVLGVLGILTLLAPLITGHAQAALVTGFTEAEVYEVAKRYYPGPHPAQPPEVRHVTRTAMCEIIGQPNCGLTGLHYQGVIYVDERLHFAHPFHASILLHEAIHYLQYHTLGGEPKTCEDWLARERQAYAIQAHVLDREWQGDPRVIQSKLAHLRCDT